MKGACFDEQYAVINTVHIVSVVSEHGLKLMMGQACVTGCDYRYSVPADSKFINVGDELGVLVGEMLLDETGDPGCSASSLPHGPSGCSFFIAPWDLNF